MGGGADFEISHRDFLTWCDSRGWTPKEQQSPPPAPPIFFGIGPDDVRHGYYFSNATHRGGWDVMYDIDRQRAWMFYSPR
jgi:hypothetical protein